MRFISRSIRCIAAVVATAAWVVAAHAGPQASSDVTVTADNVHMVGFGTASGPRAASLTAPVVNATAADIFNCPTGPELYANMQVIPGDLYLYIVAWGDDANTSGVLAKVFTGAGTTYYSGTAAWSVYATGIDLDLASTAPSAADLAVQVNLANTNGGGVGSSVGWVFANSGPGTGRLAIGEVNDANPNTVLNCPGPNVLQQVCTTGSNGIDAAANWMWYNPNPGTITQPFCADGTPRGEYLIFRVPINGGFGGAVPGSGTLSLLVLGLLTLAASAVVLWRRDSMMTA